jgi:hypothetical protein
LQPSRASRASSENFLFVYCSSQRAAAGRRRRWSIAIRHFKIVDLSRQIFLISKGVAPGRNVWPSSGFQLSICPNDV